MIYKEIIPAFDLLLEELAAIIPELNKQGKQLLDENKYSEAKEIIDKAQGVMAFQGKVKTLREEWLEMEVPQTKISVRNRKKKGSRRTTTKLPKGLRTNDNEFRIPILQALVKLGGSAKRQYVFDELEMIMSYQLNDYDWQPLPSNKRSVRWKNSAAWARQDLVDMGYLSSNSPNGIWEITEAGKTALEENVNKNQI